MMRNRSNPAHGQIDYLQLPALDLERSADFYHAVFGWQADLTDGSFRTPGLLGQWTTEQAPAPASGPVLWIYADDLWPTLERVTDHGGTVTAAPQWDPSARWLTEIEDPAGNRLGIVVAARSPQPQPMIAVRDVEASSRWYQELLGFSSDHGGPEYERLLSGGDLVLQLHQREIAHHHGTFGVPGSDVGNGVLIWFGDVADFDAVVARADQLGAPIVRAPHRNPPAGEGNGPGHREIWVKDPDGYTVVVASQDGEDYEAVTDGS